MRNHHCRFDWHQTGQIYGGDFSKFCGLLRTYELYPAAHRYAVGAAVVAIILLWHPTMVEISKHCTKPMRPVFILSKVKSDSIHVMPEGWMELG